MQSDKKYDKLCAVSIRFYQIPIFRILSFRECTAFQPTPSHIQYNPLRVSFDEE